MGCEGESMYVSGKHGKFQTDEKKKKETATDKTRTGIHELFLRIKHRKSYSNTRRPQKFRIASIFFFENEWCVSCQAFTGVAVGFLILTTVFQCKVAICDQNFYNFKQFYAGVLKLIIYCLKIGMPFFPLDLLIFDQIGPEKKRIFRSISWISIRFYIINRSFRNLKIEINVVFS